MGRFREPKGLYRAKFSQQLRWLVIESLAVAIVFGIMAVEGLNIQ